MNRPRVTVRVPAELRVFLAAERRGESTEVVTDGSSSLGHVVESLGIPLTEVGRLTVGGRDVPRAFVPGDGADVQVDAVTRPQQVPGAPLRFLLDVHLGTLARRLRLLGVDTAYQSTDIGDPALATLSAKERRVLLSRDRGLLRRRELWAGGYVYSDRPDRQLDDVLERFAPELAPWTRCVACNGPLVPADKETVRGQLADGTRKTYDVFAQCADCGRAYWKGAHHADLEAVVERAMRDHGPRPAPDRPA
ncbi:Mut7-C RNAse domain-containing protein [Streptomyces sp. NBC_01190]|uniref:Mut7-C RNAse domain-containing protein n=1 Tax=Streptomyces sp. NBC_01190 TaxID=2903767 RepID=UPI0038650151|nr:Mut7-C ubiquitin/RNAse domain-containing protein [Streptomyces sp. NBC_01190]